MKDDNTDAPDTPPADSSPATSDPAEPEQGQPVDHPDHLKMAFGDEFEKFIRRHAGEPLHVVVEPRTNLIRLATMDQTDVIEGAVLGNIFQPKR